jgi:NAD(P)-dependent dehydrogenase (short-subunit alcohol dehydrogenase family)
MTEEKTAALVIGASGGIGAAATAALAERHEQVLAVSRQAQPPAALAPLPGLRWRAVSDDEAQIGEAAAELARDLEEAGARLARVVICIGTLHGDDFRPEKSLRELRAETLLHVYRVNAVLPLLWLSALEPLLRGAGTGTVAVLSARVGSIGDNGFGGWYGYRASKAGLNMLLRSAAVELARRAPGLAMLAFHPGTTDTTLSAPFQRNVARDKLFAPAFVAEALLARMDETPADGELHFLDYAGEPVPW